MLGKWPSIQFSFCFASAESKGDTSQLPIKIPSTVQLDVENGNSNDGCWARHTSQEGAATTISEQLCNARQISNLEFSERQKESFEDLHNTVNRTISESSFQGTGKMLRYPSHHIIFIHIGV